MNDNIKMSTAILEAFDDGIYVMNQDLVVEYMNSAMVAQFGEGVGKNAMNSSIKRMKNVPGADQMKYLKVRR